MTPRKLLPVSVIAALSGLALVGWWAGRERRRSEALRTRELTQQSLVLERLTQARARLSELERKPGLQSGSPVAGSANASALPTKLPAGAPKPAAQSPVLANLAVRKLSSDINWAYGPFLSKLSKAQADGLKAIKAEGDARSIDIGDTMASEGGTPTDPTYAKLFAQSNDEENAAEEALLGEAGYAALKDYERSSAVRGMVGGLAAAVAFTSPLSADQADRLTQAVAMTSPEYRAGQPVDLDRVDWAAVDDAASAILTPEQFAVWQTDNARDPHGGWSRSAVQLLSVYEKSFPFPK